jgi:hypothetical protein
MRMSELSFGFRLQMKRLLQVVSHESGSRVGQSALAYGANYRTTEALVIRKSTFFLNGGSTQTLNFRVRF